MPPPYPLPARLLPRSFTRASISRHPKLLQMFKQLHPLPTFVSPYPVSIRPLSRPSNHRYRSIRRSAYERPLLTRAQLSPPPPSSSEPPDQNDDLDLLQRLGQVPDSQLPRNPRSERISQSKGQLIAAYQYLTEELNNDFDNILSEPITLIFTAICAILFGFVAATSATTIIGSVADWDPLAAAVLLVWTEGFTKYYYRRKKKTKFLQLINAFKIGLIYGMTLDAFKLST